MFNEVADLSTHRSKISVRTTRATALLASLETPNAVAGAAWRANNLEEIAAGRPGEVWFCTYGGGLNRDLCVDLLRQLLHRRKKPVRRVLASLPAHQTPLVRDYVESAEGRLRLHFLPGYALELKPDELVWSHVKRAAKAKSKGGNNIKKLICARSSPGLNPGAGTRTRMGCSN